jgi:hypothetical protein
VISAVGSSNKFQKISWKRDQTWAPGRGHSSLGERRTIFAKSIWDKSEVLLGTLCYLLASQNTLPISFKGDESEQSIWDKVSAIENMLENALGTTKISHYPSFSACWAFSFANALASIGAPIDDEDLVVVTLNGFKKYYNQFRTSITKFAVIFDQGKLPLRRRVGRELRSAWQYHTRVCTNYIIFKNVELFQNRFFFPQRINFC